MKKAVRHPEFRQCLRRERREPEKGRRDIGRKAETESLFISASPLLPFSPSPLLLASCGCRSR